MPHNNSKIIFFGTSSFAVPSLEALIKNGHGVSAVFTGHGPIKNLAQTKNLKIFQPISLKKNEQTLKEFRNLKPDVCVVVAYGKIIPPEYLEVPKHGFINIHPSMLPKHRGPSPIQTAILNDNKETGVSIMLVDKEIDHGPILSFAPFQLPTTIYYQEAEEKLALSGAQLLAKTLPEHLNGEIIPKEQDHNQATFTKMFIRENGRISWNEPVNKIYNQIRALHLEPRVWTKWKNKVLNIDRAEPLDIDHETTEKQGFVKKIDDKICVTAKDGYLKIESLQLEGGKKMDIKSFLNGHPDFLNSVLK